MTSRVARQELREYGERLRRQRARNQEPKQPWSFADKTDAFVFVVCMVGAVFLLALGK